MIDVSNLFPLFWVFNILAYALFIINLVDISLIFFISIIFTLFVSFIEDILCFIYNAKDIDVAEERVYLGKSRLALLTPFRFFYSALARDNINVFERWVYYKGYAKVTKRF
jgi:hypothetical protein